MQISVKTNFPEVQRKLNALQADIRAKALASAVNKTIEQARTQMIREITSEYAVKAGYVRERLRIKRASFKGGAFQIEAALIGGAANRKRSANVIAFGAREVNKGVSVKIKKVGGRKIITGAFIANKGRTVFERVPGTTMASRSKYAGSKHAEKIKPVQTIDIPQMFNQRRINAAVIAGIRAKFPTIFEREANFYVARFNRRA